jgi:MFS family permease
MKDKNEYLESIHEIRSIMERSSKFMSLSGLSGIAAGITAIISGTIAYIYLGSAVINEPASGYGNFNKISMPHEQILFFLLLAAATIFIAITLTYVFTRRNARKKNLPIWDKTAKLLTFNMLIPLITGGLFVLALVFWFGMYVLVVPATLVFYGLALVSASKYTVGHTQWLGLSEIAIGLLALLFYRYGLLFWILGFGVFHIIYGIIMYYTFESNHEIKPHTGI